MPRSSQRSFAFNASTLDFDAVKSLEDLCLIAGMSGPGSWGKALRWAEANMPLLLQQFADVRRCPKCERPMSRYKEIRTDPARVGQERIRYRCNPCNNSYQRHRQGIRNPSRSRGRGELVVTQRSFSKPQKDRAKLERSRSKRIATKGWSNGVFKAYGLTLEQYVDLLEKQNYKCAIEGCSFRHRHEEWFAIPPRRRGDRGRPNYNRFLLCVDHCHSTGRVRGLLCSRCNLALGAIEALTRDGVHAFSLYRYQQRQLDWARNDAGHTPAPVHDDVDA